jgi:hypothetical protein
MKAISVKNNSPNQPLVYIALHCKMKVIEILLVLILTLQTIQGAVNKRRHFVILKKNCYHSKPKFSISKIACDFNAEYITNSSCELKPIRRNVKLLKIQFGIFKPMETVKVVHYKSQLNS